MFSNIILFLENYSFGVFCLLAIIMIAMYFLQYTRYWASAKSWISHKFYKTNNCRKKSSAPYKNLAPVDCYEEIEPYEEMLLSALHDDDVKNIAIAGAYGSGKSSIIKTFLKRNSQYNNKIINVSLASFCTGIDSTESSEENQDQNNILQRQLELSILQQLIYHTPSKEIPYSRFRRISNISKREAAGNVLAGTLVVIVLLITFMPNIMPNFLNALLRCSAVPWVYPVLLVTISTLLLVFICWIVKFCNRLSWLKINIPNVELELSQNDASSILNRHMDEIIYYFEASSFDIVIFEDLDRFDSILIFQKLREINLILNNAKQVGRRIIFLYALRDDVFKDENRTKFFDYMVPVVPVVNISNSGDKLISFFESHKEITPAPSNDFLSDISIFIDSMRLLIGICNEYVLYHKVLSSGRLNPEKLFGIIVYKNLYPNDFVALHNNEGELAKIFQEKAKYIKERDEELLRQIADLNEELKEIEQISLIDKNELRTLYLAYMEREVDGQICTIDIGSQRHNLWECLDITDWSWFNSNNRVSVVFYRNGYRQNQVNIQLKDIETKYGSYADREKIIQKKEDQYKKEIERKIAELKSQRILLKTETIANLFSSQELPLKSNNFKAKSLIGFLVSNGHIDENYHTYISFFHEGSLTPADNEFIMSVIGMNQNLWDCHLGNISNIIDRIQLQYFDKPCILNFALLSQILVTQNKNWKDKRDAIGRLLSKLDSVVIKFIDEYIDQPDSKPEKLFEIIAIYCDDLWEIIETQGGLSDSRKDKYFSILLDGCHDQLPRLNKSDLLKSYFAQMDHIFRFVDEYGNPEVCINAIEELDIQFENMDSPLSPESLRVFDYIYENNMHAINTKSLLVILQTKQGKNFDSTSFSELNYSYIKKSGFSELIDYIDNNWSEYFNNCILGGAKQKDDQEIVVAILNNSDIDLDIRISYLLCQANSLANLQLISDNEVRNAILKNDAMERTWHNVFVCFVGNSMALTPEIATYLNKANVYTALCNERFSYSGNILTEKNAKTIFLILMMSELLSENAVSALQEASPFIWETFSIKNLPTQRIKTLMARKNFSLSHENYTALKTKAPDYHIKLIEQNSQDFLHSYKQLAIDDQDWYKILKSSIDNELKKTIIETEYSKFISAPSIIPAMLPIVENSYTKHWNIDILCACISRMRNDMALKVGLYHLKNRGFAKPAMAKIIMSLPDPYCKLVQSGARPSLPNDQITNTLVNHIKDWRIISSKEETSKKSVKITMKRFDEIS